MSNPNPAPRPFLQHISIGIGLLVLGLLLSFFDVQIVAASDPKEWPGDLRRVFKLSEIFAHGFGVAVIVFAIWNLSPHKRRFIPRLLSCAVFPPITAHLIKLLVARKRPTGFLDLHLVPTWPAVFIRNVDWFWPSGRVEHRVHDSVISISACGTRVWLGHWIKLPFSERSMVVFVFGYYRRDTACDFSRSLAQRRRCRRSTRISDRRRPGSELGNRVALRKTGIGNNR